jgi:hypothetical protein
MEQASSDEGDEEGSDSQAELGEDGSDSEEEDGGCLEENYEADGEDQEVGKGGPHPEPAHPCSLRADCRTIS